MASPPADKLALRAELDGEGASSVSSVLRKRPFGGFEFRGFIKTGEIAGPINNYKSHL